MATSVHPTAALEERIDELLQRLGHDVSYGPEKRGAIVALTDRQTPNPNSSLALAGLPIAAGATQRQISTYTATYLGTPGRSYDRETFRDYVLALLRDVGLVEPLSIRTAAQIKADAMMALTARGQWEVAKSSTNSYVLTVEAERLLLETRDGDWPAALDAFVKSSRRRRERATQVAAVSAVAVAPQASKHTALIRASTDALLGSELLAGYELVYMDDGDGVRSTDLAGLNLALDLEDRYPDVILARVVSRELWIIEAVTSDGEVDEAKLREVSAWAKKNGWTLAGATTAYATFKDFAGRQQKMQNLATGSSVWVAENGGQLIPPLVSLAPKA